MSQSSANIFYSARSRAHHLELLLLLAVSPLLWYQPLVSTLKLALAGDAYSHILLIVPLTAVLIFLRLRPASATVTASRWPGAVLLAVALLVRGFSVWNLGRMSAGNALSVSMFGLVFWWIGSVVACYGVGMFRTLLFPLCFLFLVVPIPDRAVNWITETLQYQSAVASELLFRIARVPVTRDGIWLLIPGLNIEVARECSSIRSSTILIVVTLFLANLLLRSWWRQTLLVAIAIPLSVVKNAVRIFTITELGTRVDPGYLNGRLHHHGGPVFLGLALMVILALLWTLRKNEMRASQKSTNLRTQAPAGL